MHIYAKNSYMFENKVHKSHTASINQCCLECDRG